MRLRKSPAIILLILTIFLCRIDASATSLTLGEGLKIVVEKGRLVRIATQGEDIAKAGALIARADFFPVIDASVNQAFLAHGPGVVFQNTAVPVSESRFLSYSVGIQQTLYDFKRTAARYEAGKVLVDTRKLDKTRITNAAALDFAFSYFNLLESKKLSEIADLEVERLQAHHKDATNLYNEGLITRNDLLQAEVRLSDAKQRLIGARNLNAVNASRINSALLLPLTSTVEVADVEKTGIFSEERDLEKAWQTSLHERPELKITEETIHILELEKQAKKSEFYPKIFLRSSYDYSENRYQLYEGNLSLILGAEVNLFSGGATKIEMQKLDLEETELREQNKRLTDDIKLEVQRDMLETDAAREKIMAVKDAVRQAEENLRINKTRYQEGIGTATEVLDAVTLLTATETNYYRAIYDLGRAEAALAYSMGRDLTELYK